VSPRSTTCHEQARGPSAARPGGHRRIGEDACRKPIARRKALAALRRESDRALVDLIRRRLALPVAKRMNFLRARVSFRGSAL
jgi:hypothetical protein